MRPCNLPPGVPLQYFRKISRAKTDPRKTRLRRLRRRVRATYENFQSNEADLTAIAPAGFSKEEKADLLHCYKPAGKELNAIKALISQVQPDSTRHKCPYCWIDAPRTTDHYLPKEDFPEFAVHAFNLTPACQSCNGKKGRRYRGSTGKMFLDVYRDSLPAGQYLTATLIIKSGTPKATFELIRPPHFTDEEFRLLTSHFKELGLLRRFSQGAAEVFSETIRQIRAHHPAASANLVKKFLRDEANSLAGDFHPNVWRAVLFRAMSGSPDFIAICQNAVAP